MIHIINFKSHMINFVHVFETPGTAIVLDNTDKLIRLIQSPVLV